MVNLNDKTWGAIIIGLVIIGLVYLRYATQNSITTEAFNSQATQAVSIQVNWKSSPFPDGKHGDASPGKRFPQVIQEFGLPDIIDVNPNGVAIWKKTTLAQRGFCWDRVEIHDEQLPHIDPSPHVDFLYTWYYLPVPDHLVTDVRAVSDSVTYDPLKKMLRARCHAMGPNIATMALCKRIATGEITLQQARNLYGPTIMSTMPGSENFDHEAKKKLELELCLHQKQLEGVQMNDPNHIFVVRPGATQ